MESDFEDIFDIPVPDDNNDPPADDGEIQEGQLGIDANRNDTTLDGSLLKRRTIRKPQPKLDAERLCGERGLPQLVKVYDSLEFKGKGYEAQDLRLIMRTLEHWAHRLYPKLNFDECLDKIEQLGTKKSVKTSIKRIRLGLDDAEDNAEDAALSPGNIVEDVEISDVDPFDELTLSNFAESENNPPSPVINQTSNVGNNLTEDQLSRMERNRLLAREKRKSQIFKLQSEKEEYIDLVSENNTELVELE